MKYSIKQFPMVAGAIRTSRLEKFKAIAWFEQSLQDINKALTSSLVYNTDYEGMKEVFSRAVDDTWTECFAKPYAYGGKYKELPAGVLKVYEASIPSSLHDMFALKKRVDKCKDVHPSADALRQIVAELYPLAESMQSLKSKIVKGRRPSSNPPKPVNPNKIVKTCPCCFRQIAVDGTMVHHGYRRPGDGYQTSSCAGIRFKPLEESPEGLDWMIGQKEELLAELKKSRDSKDSWTVVFYQNQKVTPDDANWKRAKEITLSRIESDARHATLTIIELTKKREAWKPVV